MSFLETGQHDGAFVDFKGRSDGSFECITVQSVKEIMDKVRVLVIPCINHNNDKPDTLA